MTVRRQRGQAMVELALGVGLFLVASLGAAQLGIAALSAEGAQSAALVGDRTASAAPVPGDPLARLEDGQAAAALALRGSDLDLGSLVVCPLDAPAAGCGLPARCATYRAGLPPAGTGEACPDRYSDAPGMGPMPSALDGSQNPACGGSGCFGVASSMAPCRHRQPPGTVRVCLAYTSWPATRVDIWVRGSLRSVVPLLSSAGFDALPLDVQLRLQVEGLS
ncbi:MAG: hypothetical protein ACREN7_07880 [Candidatus Dormibacteria bacterium]